MRRLVWVCVGLWVCVWVWGVRAWLCCEGTAKWWWVCSFFLSFFLWFLLLRAVGVGFRVGEGLVGSIRKNTSDYSKNTSWLFIVRKNTKNLSKNTSWLLVFYIKKYLLASIKKIPLGFSYKKIPLGFYKKNTSWLFI